MPSFLLHPVDKSALRQQARQRRRALPRAFREQASNTVSEFLRSRIVDCAWQRVAAYSAVASELSLDALFRDLPTPVELALPAITADGVMTFRRWHSGQPLVAGPYGISQPGEDAAELDLTRLDAVLLPLLGFDLEGTRLGSGAGYYDRALAFRQTQAAPPALIGIAYSVQQFDSLPRDAWDVPLDAVVTESGWLPLRKPTRR